MGRVFVERYLFYRRYRRICAPRLFDQRAVRQSERDVDDPDRQCDLFVAGALRRAGVRGRRPRTVELPRCRGWQAAVAVRREKSDHRNAGRSRRNGRVRVCRRQYLRNRREKGEIALEGRNFGSGARRRDDRRRSSLHRLQRPDVPGDRRAYGPGGMDVYRDERIRRNASVGLRRQSDFRSLGRPPVCVGPFRRTLTVVMERRASWYALFARRGLAGGNRRTDFHSGSRPGVVGDRRFDRPDAVAYRRIDRARNRRALRRFVESVQQNDAGQRRMLFHTRRPA